MGIAEHNWGESEAADEVWKLVLGLDPAVAGNCLAVALVAYIDDSRSPPDGTLVLAGHVATVENWAALSAEWKPLLRFAPLNKNNVREFKMSEMMQTPERIENIQPFYRLIEKYVLASLSVTMNIRDYRRAQARICVPWRRIQFGELNNPHMFAYRALMDLYHANRHKLALNVLGEEQIDFIFDEQSESRKILAGWDAYMAGRTPEVRKLYGQMPVFRNSEKYMPLQAADLWAGWTRICEEEGRRYEVHPPDFGSWKGSEENVRPVYCGVWSEDQLAAAIADLVRAYLPPGYPVWDVRFPF